MRQLITRIDDDLHARLKEKAEADGRSMNALVVAALQEAVGPPPTPRERLHRKAARLGIEFVYNDGPPPEPGRFERALEMTKGIGPMVDAIIQEDRGPKE